MPGKAIAMLENLVLVPLLISSLTSQHAEVSPFAVKTDETIQLIVPFTHQYDDLNDTDKAIINYSACGPAVLTMAVKFLGADVSLSDVISKLPNTVYIKGDRFYKLTDGPSYLGHKAVEIEPSPKQIYATLASGFPVVLNIQNYDGIVGHAVLVVGIKGFNGETAESLIVHDPFVGPYREFKYSDASTLIQPEGYYNPIGIIKPFYVKGMI